MLKALAAAKYCYQVASPDHRRASSRAEVKDEDFLRVVQLPFWGAAVWVPFGLKSACCEISDFHPEGLGVGVWVSSAKRPGELLGS